MTPLKEKKGGPLQSSRCGLLLKGKEKYGTSTISPDYAFTLKEKRKGKEKEKK